MPRPEYLVIITGLSGSGKSYVQSTLEDLGFYCSDNLPIALIEPFLEEVGAHENATASAIVVDVRTHDFANDLPDLLSRAHPEARPERRPDLPRSERRSARAALLGDAAAASAGEGPAGARGDPARARRADRGEVAGQHGPRHLAVLGARAEGRGHAALPAAGRGS